MIILLTPELALQVMSVLNLLSPSHPATVSAFLSLSFPVLSPSVSPFLSSLYMCFSLSADVILISLLLYLLYMLSPSLHFSVSTLSSPVRSAEPNSDRKIGQTVPCVSNNLAFWVIISFFSFNAPFL